MVRGGEPHPRLPTVVPPMLERHAGHIDYARAHLLAHSSLATQSSRTCVKRAQLDVRPPGFRRDACVSRGQSRLPRATFIRKYRAHWKISTVLRKLSRTVTSKRVPSPVQRPLLIRSACLPYPFVYQSHEIGSCHCRTFTHIRQMYTVMLDL